MKKLLAIITILFAAFACTPTLEPDVIDQPGNESRPGQQEQPADDVHVQSIELSAATLSLQPGETVTLTAKVIPDDATDQTLAWSSSNESVVTVSPFGVVEAIAEGSSVVSVTCDGITAECAVSVAIVTIPVASVSLDMTTAALIVGETLQLTATVLPDDATDKTVTWSTSNAGLASVENGLVTALAAGEATITAMAGEWSASCTVTISEPFSYGGLCLEAIGGGTVSISNPNGFNIGYKVENKAWTSTNDTYFSIQAKAGERVWLRGQNDTYTKGDAKSGFTNTSIDCYSGDFYLYGNLMSLIYGDDYASRKEITGEYAFSKLFMNNNNIVNHPTLDIELPATTLSPSCYRNMFYQCSKLTRAPKLPAKVLTEACYASMFAYCTALKEFPEMAATDMAYLCCTWMMRGSGIEEAPELPAMNLARSCYEFMFMECPNLKKAMSVLPATKLAPQCYTGMFQRSAHLENAPELPATELSYNCYSHMFNGCEALKKAPALPATSLAEGCYQRMFGNSGLTEAPELPAMDMAVWCYRYMFEGCKSLTKAPVLPATKLNLWCYESMFHGCSSLNYIKADFLTKPSADYTANWVDGVAATGTFVKNPDATWNVRGVNGIPEGWTIE